MSIPAADVTVGSGTGVSNTTGRMVPLVRLTVTVEGRTVVATMGPNKARQIGWDLVAAAAHGAADTAIRSVAREHGLDGDGLVAEFAARAGVPPDDD